MLAAARSRTAEPPLGPGAAPAPRVMSSTGCERSLFLPREHLEITRDPAFRNNIPSRLLEDERRA